MAFMQWSGLAPLQDEIQRGLVNLGHLISSHQLLIGWSPDFDIFECDNEIIVRVDLPDISKDDINISVTGDMLTIFGERKTDEKIKEYLVYRQCPHGRFRRDVQLHHPVDTENIKASYKNGVLEIVLPKREGVKGKQIEVSVE